MHLRLFRRVGWRRFSRGGERVFQTVEVLCLRSKKRFPFGEKWKKVLAAKLEVSEIFIVIATLGTVKGNSGL